MADILESPPLCELIEFRQLSHLPQLPTLCPLVTMVHMGSWVTTSSEAAFLKVLQSTIKNCTTLHEDGQYHLFVQRLPTYH